MPKSTEARCLVYTRAQAQGADELLEQQVPATLQESIDSVNQDNRGLFRIVELF